MRAPEETVAWLRSYYAAMDGLRFDEVAGFLAEDISTLYPTGIEVTGRPALMTQTERALCALDRIRHEIVSVWAEGDELIFELDVTYWRRDGDVITRSGMGIFVMEDGRVKAQRLFVDLSGIWD